MSNLLKSEFVCTNLILSSTGPQSLISKGRPPFLTSTVGHPFWGNKYDEFTEVGEFWDMNFTPASEISCFYIPKIRLVNGFKSLRPFLVDLLNGISILHRLFDYDSFVNV